MGREVAVTSPIDSIPMPVERCLRFALWNVPGRTIGEVRLAQVGSLRTELHTERWLSFEATHHVRPGQVAFEWIARVRIAPLVHLRVRDALENGTGSSDLKLWSVLPVARAGPSPEMNAGSLHRFLAEAAWYPSVLRPSERLHWNAIDDTRARATLDAHGTSVELEFRFGPRGE